MRALAFSDYRVQDIGLLIKEISKLDPKPDIILYAGDDVDRFRPSKNENLFEELARCSHYGLCAVIGNDEVPQSAQHISGRNVYDVHSVPVTFGDYAVLGVEGSPSPPGFVVYSEKEISNHLAEQRHLVGKRKLIILSHTPPFGILDKAVRFSPDRQPRSIGSRALKNFIQKNRNAVLVTCGHVHRCGGQNASFGNTIVANAACHDDFGAIGRFAVIDIEPNHKPIVEWREIHETSSIAGIGPTTFNRLRLIGIRTVRELASAPPELLRTLSLGRKPEILQARARAHLEMRPIVICPLDIPKKTEVFLDFETDLNGGCDYIWLIGACVGRNGSYRSFFADSPKDESAMLAEFLNFMAPYPDAALLTFSGSKFEERVLRARLAAHKLETSLCERMLDLSPLFWNSVALPTGSEELKEAGAFLGYKYRFGDLRGYDIALRYEQEYILSKNARRRARLKRQFLEYNEDDVRCLPFILDAFGRLSAL